MLPDFLFCFSFPCSADHERDWPPCKVVFRVGNQYAECEKQQQQQQQQQSGEKKLLGGIKGCKYKTSSWRLNGSPDGNNIGSTV